MARARIGYRYYDTEDAEIIGTKASEYEGCREILYKTREGAFFTYLDFSDTDSPNETEFEETEEIVPLSPEDACLWLLENAGGRAARKQFPWWIKRNKRVKTLLATWKGKD